MLNSKTPLETCIYWRSFDSDICESMLQEWGKCQNRTARGNEKRYVAPDSSVYRVIITRKTFPDSSLNIISRANLPVWSAGGLVVIPNL